MDLGQLEKMARQPVEEISDRELLAGIASYITAGAHNTTFEMRRIGAIIRHRSELYDSLASIWRYLHLVRASDPPDPFTLASNH